MTWRISSAAQRKNISVAMAAGALVLGVFAADVGAQDACPSAEACLDKSFDRNWTQYYSLIEQTWAEKKKVAELILRAEKIGRNDLVAQLKAEQARIDARWAFASGVARALTAPHFKTFIAAQRDLAVRRHAVERERTRKETDLYRRLVRGSIGPERNSVIGDITGYEREAYKLRKTFFSDTFIVSLSAVKEGAALATKAWTQLATLPYVQAMNAQIAAGAAATEAVHSGMHIEEVTRRHQYFPAMVEGVRSAATGTLRLAELAAAGPDNPVKEATMRKVLGPVAPRAATYANVLALGLDTLLIVKTVDRLKATEARQGQVETSDAHWRARVDTAARRVADAAAREARAVRQVENQRKVEALFQQIQQEGGQ